MRILVTGGVGYIGSFMVRKLLENGNDVIVVDNFEKGQEAAIEEHIKVKKGNLLNKKFVSSIFNESYDSVIHFAAYISMGESMRNPYKYFENNTLGLLNVLEGMVRSKTERIIFSSTAGVYGSPIQIPIPEDHPKNPTNPYGESKLMAEKILKWYQKVYKISFAALRYFNAAGGSLDGSMGEDHFEETHIIPNAIKAILENREFILYGDTYNTVDGTCVRDYIHVLDLVEAHSLALRKIEHEPGAYYYNVGTGKGRSNKEILDMTQKVSGQQLRIQIADKRPGDADILIADSSKIKKELGFSPKYSDVETIVKSAWEWHKKNSK